MKTRHDRTAWSLGEPGSDLEVAVRARRPGDGIWRVVVGGCALLLSVTLEAKWDASVGFRAWGALIGVSGAALVFSARPRHGRLRVNGETLTGPRWGLVSTETQRRALRSIGAVGDVPTTTAFGAPSELAELTLGASSKRDAPATYFVDRARAAELVHRLRLRIAGASLGLPDAARLMELYFRPGPKPLGVAYLRDAWVPFDSPRALFEESASHPFRDRQRVRVFMAPSDFQMVVDAYPQLPLERVASDLVEAS